MTKTRFLALVTALALLLAIPTAVFAQKVPPHVFVGTVTLDGATAADGAAITVWIDGVQVASTTASGGDYNVLVEPEGDASFTGKTVSFKVSGVDATESAVWIQGGGDVLNLTGDSSASAAAGEAGDDGARGPRGLPGIAGDTGPAGPAGAAGSPGPAGPAGSDGADGTDGASGATGSAGSAGPAGPAGSAGADGADGGGIIAIIALIIAAVALLAAGGSYMMGRRA